MPAYCSNTGTGIQHSTGIQFNPVKMNASKQVKYIHTILHLKLHNSLIIFLSKSDYLLDDISTILVKSEPPINLVPDELRHFPPQELANVHDNSFTTYFSEPEAFNLNLCNEEVVYTEGEAQEYIVCASDCVDNVEYAHNKDESRVKTELVKYSSDPGNFFG